LKVNSASCWFLLYGYITMHGPQNVTLLKTFSFANIRLTLTLTH